MMGNYTNLRGFAVPLSNDLISLEPDVGQQSTDEPAGLGKARTVTRQCRLFLECRYPMERF